MRMGRPRLCILQLLVWRSSRTKIRIAVAVILIQIAIIRPKIRIRQTKKGKMGRSLRRTRLEGNRSMMD